MKELNVKTLIAALFLVSILAFNNPFQVNNGTAQVNQYQNLYIFSDSKPVKEYDYLGTIKSSTGGFGSAQYESVRDRLIKKAKKEYPQANAIILNLKEGKADQADVILLK